MGTLEAPLGAPLEASMATLEAPLGYIGSPTGCSKGYIGSFTGLVHQAVKGHSEPGPGSTPGVAVLKRVVLGAPVGFVVAVFSAVQLCVHTVLFRRFPGAPGPGKLGRRLRKLQR